MTRSLVTSPFTVIFLRSSASTYPEAVHLAKSATTYAEAPDGRRLVHTATFGVRLDELMALRNLWGVVRTWKGARLVVDGVEIDPQDRWRWLEVLTCLTRAATFDPPQRYCQSGLARDLAGVPPTLPAFPCRLFLVRRAFDLGHRVDWRDPSRRLDQVRALLLEQAVGRCPFLRLGPFEAALTGWSPDVPTADSGPLPRATPSMIDETLRRILSEDLGHS